MAIKLSGFPFDYNKRNSSEKMKVQILSKFPIDVSDQQSETPNYVKAYDNLYRLIIDGTIKDGDKLPSENAMAKHWGVSR